MTTERVRAENGHHGQQQKFLGIAKSEGERSDLHAIHSEGCSGVSGEELASVRNKVDAMDRERLARLSARIERMRPVARSRVYFVECAEAAAVKIGHALEPEKRLSELQVGCPLRLELIAVAWGGAREEAELHALFGDLRLRGEWFRLTGELENFALALIEDAEDSGETYDLEAALKRHRSVRQVNQDREMAEKLAELGVRFPPENGKAA